MEKCSDDVFQNGKIIAIIFDVDEDVIETWVQGVAKNSGQKVDWFFAGGRIVVKALGDLEAVDKCAFDITDFEKGRLRGLGNTISRVGYYPGGENHWSKQG